jgi:phenylacetate-CoA ligase
MSEGAEPAAFGVQRLVCIGEPVRQQDFSLSPLGQRLRDLWGAAISGTYASTEMATGFTECEHGCGGHMPPELVIVEVVDERGRPVPDGEPGEVVATPLQVTGMPLLRFKTGDIAALHRGACPCGASSARLGPLLGRKASVLKYRGTTVYPEAIFSVLQGIPAVRAFYLEISNEYEMCDHIKVVVGAEDGQLTPALVASRIAAAIRVKPEVVIEDAEVVRRRTLRDDKRKPVLLFDRRIGEAHAALPAKAEGQ